MNVSLSYKIKSCFDDSFFLQKEKSSLSLTIGNSPEIVKEFLEKFKKSPSVEGFNYNFLDI